MEAVPVSEVIRRVAALWGPVRRPPERLEVDELPPLIRLDPCTGPEARTRLDALMARIGVRLEGPVEARPQLVWPSEARCRRSPPLLVLDAGHAVVFEREAPDEAWLALQAVAATRKLRPTAVWLGGGPVPEGWVPMALDQLLEQAT